MIAEHHPNEPDHRLPPLQARIAEAAALVGVSPNDVRAMLDRGDLAATGQGRLRRVPMSAVHAQLAQPAPICIVEPLQVRVHEAAEILRVSPRTIYDMLERGELTSTGQGKLRRIPMASLRTWVQQHTVRART